MDLGTSTMRSDERQNLKKPEPGKLSSYKEMLLWVALATLSLSMIFLLFVNFIEWILAKL